MKNLFIFIKEKLLKLENIHSNYTTLSLLSNKYVRKIIEKKIVFKKESFFENNPIYIGEIFNSKAINVFGKPEYNGLFCERIFGPIINHSCGCKKFFNIYNIKKRCDECYVEIINARVRRYRIGYIELITPMLYSAYIHYIQLLLNDPFHIQISYDFLDNIRDYGALNYDEILLLDNIIYSIYKEDDDIILDNIKINNLNLINKKYIKNDFFQFFNTYRLFYVVNELYNHQIQKFGQQNKNLEIIDGYTKFYFIIYKYLENLKAFPLFADNINKINLSLTKCLSGIDLIKYFLEKINIKIEIQNIYNRINFLYLSKQNEFEHCELDEYFNLLIKKLRLLNNFWFVKVAPENLIYSIIPVLPPTLRAFTHSYIDDVILAENLNILYENIIDHNNIFAGAVFSNDKYIKEVNKLKFFNYKFFLYRNVNLLISFSQDNTTYDDINKNSTYGILDLIKGKDGHYRQFLLGRRVDYSGRSVIVPGPYLLINQCGVPYEILYKLFEPYIIQFLIGLFFKFFNIKKKNLEYITQKLNNFIVLKKPFLIKFISNLIKNKYIILNRAPTLHRYGIQAFNAKAILNKTICLHPFLCEGFNADFDGDQMGIHVPLTSISQLESQFLLITSKNLFSSKKGQPIIKLSHEMIIGNFYIIFQNKLNNIIVPKWFSSEEYAINMYLKKNISLHSLILVKTKFNSIIFDRNVINILNFPYVNSLFDIDIYNIYELNKIYIFTNIGLLICQLLNNNNCITTEIFYKTTIGKLFFFKNCQHVLKNFKKYITSI